MANSRAKTRRRNRTAFLATACIIILFIIIIFIIIFGVVSKGKKKKSDQPVITATAQSTLPTVNPDEPEDPNEDEPTDEPTEEPGESEEPDTPTPTPGSNKEGTKMYVTRDGVNVRKEASTESSVIGQLSSGKTVTAYEKMNGFYRVKLSNGDIGYISAQFLSTSETTEAPKATPDTSKSTTMYTTSGSVNVRKEPSTSAVAVTRITKTGTAVTAYKESGGWYYVKTSTGFYGYISKSLLSATDPNKATPTGGTTATATAKTTDAPTPTPAPTSKSVMIAAGIPAELAEKFASKINISDLGTGKAVKGSVRDYTTYTLGRVVISYKTGTDYEDADFELK